MPETLLTALPLNDNLLPMPDVNLVALNHASPEFDAAYDVISEEISPEFLEPRDFLRTRLAVRDQGPKNPRERLLVQDGYTLHLIAALQQNEVMAAIYGHLISGITSKNKAAGFVTYIAVRRSLRRRGIGTKLIRKLQQAVEADALRLTGQPVIGMVYEIEEQGKDDIKAVVGRLGARPLDIVYHQPALRPGAESERMDLWFQSSPPLSPERSADFVLDAELVEDLVRSLLVMEYVGQDVTGFNCASRPYTAFQESIKGRKTVGFIRR